MKSDKNTKQPMVSPNDNQYPRKIIHCEASDDMDQTGRDYANLITSPEFASYRIIEASENKQIADDIDIPGLLTALRNQAEAINRNDMSQLEGMLTNQAVSLQGLFVRMIEKAFQQKHPPHFEVLMKLALKAQSQSRATIETLSAIKNPPTVFAHQANIAHGHQQVNNNHLTTSRARENQKQQNELLKDSNEAVDSSRTITAIATDQELATVETIDRCNNPTR